MVIDEEKVINKKTKKLEDYCVDKEATHTARKGLEKIFPNPDPTDKESMYLKRPTKKPKRLFEPHNKKLNIPKHLDKKIENRHKKIISILAFRLCLKNKVNEILQVI